MRDLGAVAWLRWRQFKDGAIYWMRVAGYDPTQRALSQNLYILYLVGIGMIWVVSMGGLLFQSARGIGDLLEPQTAGSIVNALPMLIFGLQVYVVCVGLRATPLKLTFADMAYLAGSPISRSAPVLFGYIRQALTRFVVLGLLLAFVPPLLYRHLSIPADQTGWASLRLLGGLLPIIALTWAGAWVAGILRLIEPRIARLPFVWLLPLLIVPIAVLLPDAFLWQGRALMLLLVDSAPAWVFPLLIVLAGGLIVIFVRLGERIDMIRAVDESVMFARLQALGMLAYTQPRVRLRIAAQNARASRKPLFRLPRAHGFGMLVARAAISYARHPMLLVTGVLWGVMMSIIVAQVLLGGSAVQAWIFVLLIAGIVPPLALLHVYSQDVEEKFLRQLLPVDGLQLLIADALLPIASVALGGAAAWLIFDFDPAVTVMGVVIIPFATLLLTLCGAYSLTTTRPVQMRILATALSFGVCIAAGSLLGVYAAIGALFFALLVLAGLVGAEA